MSTNFWLVIAMAVVFVLPFVLVFVWGVVKGATGKKAGVNDWLFACSIFQSIAAIVTFFVCISRKMGGDVLERGAISVWWWVRLGEPVGSALSAIWGFFLFVVFLLLFICLHMCFAKLGCIAGKKFRHIVVE